MPDAHPTAHLFWTLALAGVSAGLIVAVRNPLIRRRLLFAAVMLAVSIALHAAIVWLPGVVLLHVHGWKIEALLAVFAVVSAFVSLLFNPWSADRAAELKQTLFDLKNKHSTGVLDSTADLRKTKREIARILMVAREKEIAAASAGKAKE